MGGARGGRPRRRALSLTGWRTHLHAALRHPSEPRVLLLRSDRAWRLPRARVRGRFWAAEVRPIVEAFEARLGTRPWLLRRLHTDDDAEARKRDTFLELELLDPLWSAPAHGRWIGAGDLGHVRLADESHRELLAGYFQALDDVPEQRAPWSRPGWIGGVRRWLAAEVARLGHVLVGVEQVKHWSISSVLRVETDSPELYFKVPLRLPLFVEEAVVTQRLAERFPGHLPSPLAVEPEQGWMLLPAFDELVGWRASLAVREESLRRFARLQRRTADVVDELLADGCLDRRLPVLERQIDSLVADAAAVTRLTAEEAAELRELAPTFKRLCRRLDELGLPATLVHGDLHFDNVARLDGSMIFFDWTDACIAHPFIDLLSLQWVEDEAARAALLEAYLEPWDGALPADRLREAVELAGVVIPLHHAVSYQTIVTGLEPSTKGELDATHEFLREALARVRPFLDSP